MQSCITTLSACTLAHVAARQFGWTLLWTWRTVDHRGTFDFHSMAAVRPGLVDELRAFN
jgi:hypothetical protein